MPQPKRPRTIAIGDIHGHAKALAGLLERIAPQANDTLITLGDYIDGGPDSRGVIETLIALGQQCHLVPLLGNHEDMLLGAKNSDVEERHWRYSGGEATLASYGGKLANIPTTHWKFFEACQLHHETERHFFVHASYDPWLPLARQDLKHLLWLSVREAVPGPHTNGKVAVVGHTVQPKGQILDLPHLKCLDTGCGEGGFLTAMDIDSGQLWQVDEAGGQR